MPSSSNSLDKGNTAPDRSKPSKADPPNIDQQIEEEVDLLISRMSDADFAVRTTAISQLRGKLRDGTGSVTSLPKPLKFVRANVEKLAGVYKRFSAEAQASQDAQTFLADVADLLAFVMTTFAPNDSKVTSFGSALHWKLLGNPCALAPWGHEFVRHLTADVTDAVLAGTFPYESVTPLISAILEFEFTHNGEIHAVDFALEIHQLDRLMPFLTVANFDAIGKYLKSVSAYLPKGEDVNLLKFIGDTYFRFGYAVDAARFWLRVGEIGKVQTTLSAKDVPIQVRTQIAHLSAVHGGVLTADFLEKLQAETSSEKLPELTVEGESHLADDCTPILRALRIADRERYFLHVTNRLDLKPPKKPSDILKTSFDHSSSLFDFGSDTGPRPWTTLAKCIVDGLANAAHGEGSSTDDSLKKVSKSHHLITAIASQGLLQLWRQDDALNALDMHYSSDDANIKAGASLATGMVFAGSPCAEFDPAYAMLGDHIPRNVLVGDSVSENSKMLRITSIVGLGIAYAGTMDSRITEALVPILVDSEEDIEVQSFAALAIGLVFIGSMHQDTVEALTLALMEKTDADLSAHFSIVYMILGLAMLFLGHREEADTMIMTTKTFPQAIQEFTEIAIISLAYSGTGNVMQMQRFLNHLIRKPTEAEESAGKGEEEAAVKADSSAMVVEEVPVGSTPSAATLPTEGFSDMSLSDKQVMENILGNTKTHESSSTADSDKKATDKPCYSSRALAVLGIGLISMAEDIGADMCKRMMDHILQFGGPEARRGIPMALAVMSISDPGVTVLESLAKLSHDSDAITAQNAIIGIGFVAAGTNNSRAITLLRNLNSYYAKDDTFLFLSHFSMGLVSLGKGLMTLSPLHSERFLLSNVSLAGILAVAFTMLEPSRTVFDQYHFMLLLSVTAMRPRSLLTIDTNGNPHDLTVRVGTAVDTVATVGKPKTITGFQTHNTPALLAARENAEIPYGLNDPAMDAISPVIEGVVIVEKSAE